MLKALMGISMLGLLAAGRAMAADYSVGIVKLGTEFEGGGTAVNLYSTTTKGINIIQTYVLPQLDQTGHLARPLTLAMNPAQDFVYVAYTGLSIPNLVGFKVTATGLVPQWEVPLQTGDSGLSETTIVAGSDYVIQSLYPGQGQYLVVLVISQETGATVATMESPQYLVSGHVFGPIASANALYFSCTAAARSTPPPPCRYMVSHLPVRS